MPIFLNRAKISKLGLGALLATTALCSSLSAFAADRIVNAQPVKDWAGLYYGVHVGGLLGETTALEYGGFWDYGEYSKAEWGALGGAQIGINKQIGNFVYGIEGDFSFTSFSVNQNFDDLATDPWNNSGEWEWLATLRAKAGLAVGNGLFYTTAGLAFVKTDYQFGELDDPTDLLRVRGIQTGLAVGAGYEHAIDANWSLRAEYLYIGLPDEMVQMNGETGAFVSSAHIGRFALNYTLGGTYGVADSSQATTGDWSGSYVGANLTGLLGASSSLEYSGPWDYSEYSIQELALAGGIQFGHNWQFGHTVLGIEGDINLSSFSNEHIFNTDYRNSASWDSYSTIRLRAGVAAGNTLAYLTAGVAVVKPEYAFGDTTGTMVTSNPTKVGLAIGAGVEVALNDRWSTRLEYLYIGLPEDFIPDFDGDPGSFVSSAHMARVSVNYALGDGIAPGSGTALPNAVNWEGFYAGVTAGAMMVSATATEYEGPWDYGNYSITDWAGLAGGVAGKNWQTGNFVYGFEGDFAWTSFDKTHNFSTDDINSAEMQWLATLRGRAGLAAGNSMIYATGGLAFAKMHHEYGDTSPTPVDVSLTETVVGLAVGAGIEHDFGNGWSGRLEALHIALPSIVDFSDDPDLPMNFTTSSNIAKISFVKRM